MNSNVSSTTYLIFIISIIIVISSNYAIGILCLHMYVFYGILVGGKQLIILVSMLT